MATSPWKPWHQVVQLRDDLKTGKLSLAVFASEFNFLKIYSTRADKHRRKPGRFSPS
jgi:hypothetical protein